MDLFFPFLFGKLFFGMRWRLVGNSVMFFLCSMVRGGVCVYLEKERGFFLEVFIFQRPGMDMGVVWLVGEL